MEQSVAFAEMVQNELKKSSKRSDRGVRQAGFLVLRETSMPSVLVELGFISNPAEEEYMTSLMGQQSLANSLFNAFTQYKAERDRKIGGYSEKPEPAKTTAQTVTPKATPTKPEPPKPVVTSPPAVTNTPKVSESPKVSENPKGQVVYKLQILTSGNVLPANSHHLKGYKASYYKDTDGLYKYTYGETTNTAEINQISKALKKDFPDAFIVRFVNGVRVR